MKKHVSLFEVDKGLKSLWHVQNDLETTTIGENLYRFTFSTANIYESILEKQPWNFRGSLVILDRAVGDECLFELSMHSVPF